MSGGGSGGDNETATVTAATAVAAMAMVMATATTTAAVATMAMKTEATTVVMAGVHTQQSTKSGSRRKGTGPEGGTATAGHVQFAHVRAVEEVQGNERCQLLGCGLASDVKLHKQGVIVLELGQSVLQDLANLLVGVLVLLQPILALVVVIVVVVIVVINVVIIDGGGVIVA